MSEDFVTLLEQFEKEKGISRDVLIEALEQALVSAYKRNYGSHKNVRVEIDRQNGSMNVYVKKEVVDEVVIPDSEISLENAKKINPQYELGDVIEEKTALRWFQAGKQPPVRRGSAQSIPSGFAPPRAPLSLMAVRNSKA